MGSTIIITRYIIALALVSASMACSRMSNSSTSATGESRTPAQTLETASCSSADGSTLFPGSTACLQTVDGVWTMSSQAGLYGNIILLNGQNAGWAIELFVAGGQMYSVSSYHIDFQWDRAAATWNWVPNLPAVAATPAPAPAPAPTSVAAPSLSFCSSADGSTLFPGSTACLQTVDGVWTMSSQAGLYGNIILLNGQNAGWAIELFVAGGQMYSVSSYHIDFQWDRAAATWNWVPSLPTVASAPTVVVTPAPIGFALSSSTYDSLTVAWTSGGGATIDYYLSITPGATATACNSNLTPVISTSFVESNLNPNATYTLALCAANSSNLLSSQVSLTVKTPSPPTPAAVSNLLASSVTTSSFSLSWNAAGGLTSYYAVAIAAGTSAPACSSGQFVSGTSTSEANLAGNTTYSVSICSVDSYGNVSAPTVLTVVTSAPVIAPSPPTTPVTTPAPVAPGSLASDDQSDEFIGPFASWDNLRSKYGAKGDGVSDDTAAIQNALNNLGINGNSPVLYIPAGTYLITQTVSLVGGQNMALIGADPATTSFKWGGASGGTLFHIDGVATSRYSRLTFDANSSAAIAVDQSSTGASSARAEQFDTGNEYSDDVFKNATYGIRGGEYGGASESSILRCQFLSNKYGVILKNFNALDWFIWYSTFKNNSIGLSNSDVDGSGAGNFHAYYSLFEGSASSDIVIGNSGQFNFRGNTSIGSHSFIYEGNIYTNGLRTLLEGNTVIDPVAAGGYAGIAVYSGNLGNLMMVDNIFAVSPGPAVYQGDGSGGFVPDTMSVGNTYTVSNALVSTGFGSGAGRLITSNDQVVARSSLNLSAPAMPGTLQNYNRTVFEVPAGSTEIGIQAAINQAQSLCGSKPVVHLPYGNYSISNTITIPAGCDLQLVGDGGMSRLNWYGSVGGSVLDLKGPSRASLRDFYIYANQTTSLGNGILVENSDQPSSRVYMLEAAFNRAVTANLFSDGLDYTYIVSRDIEHGLTNVYPADSGSSVKVVGGPLAAAGNAQSGRVSLYAGSGGADHITYSVSNGGSLMVQDIWYEGTQPSTYALISDNSQFTVEGSQIALPESNGDAIDISNFSGNVSIFNSDIMGVTKILTGNGGSLWMDGESTDGTPSGSALNSPVYLLNQSPATTAVFSDNRFYSSSASGSTQAPNMGPAPSASFINMMLAQDRANRYVPIADLPAGVTDVRIYRVTTELGSYGIHIQK